MTKQTLLMLATVLLTLGGVKAQTVHEELLSDVNRAAGTSYALPASNTEQDTPAPEGKRPFYVNHYGTSGSYYPVQPSFYDDPYTTFAKADSLGKLTSLGHDVMRRLALLREEARDRSGELSAAGVRQVREQISQLTRRFPDMIQADTYVNARSIRQNHCILTMEEAMLQFSMLQQPLRRRHQASHRNLSYLNPQDKELLNLRTDSLTLARYAAFAAQHTDDERLMSTLFNDADYLGNTVDVAALSRQLFEVAGSIQNMENSDSLTLFDIFTPEETLQHWLKKNAWNYICYGSCTLNGGLQPYSERTPLRKMIQMGDSLKLRTEPTLHLRYTNENVLMSLACLMELDNYGLATHNLETLDEHGWADYRIAPMGGSIQMIHYRKDKDDDDVLVKVLLNGRETRLPVDSDCAPYYHWEDVKRYYLRKLYIYENIRFAKKAK